MRRIELQYLVATLTLSCSLTVAAHVIGSALKIPTITRVGVFFLLIGFAISAWGLAHHRIFNIREFVATLVHSIVSLTLYFLGLYISLYLFDGQTMLLQMIFITCISLAVYRFHITHGRWMHRKAAKELAAIRTAVMDLANLQLPTEELAARCEEILKAGFSAPEVFFYFERKFGLESDRFNLNREYHIYDFIREAGWATPESLIRRSNCLGAAELLDFFRRRGLGAVVSIPHGSRAPSILIAFTQRQEVGPFTYPEIERIQAVGELIDNVLVRSRLVEQAALQAKLDDLAVMSRGLAHDLRNLITPVSSFLVHSERIIPPGTTASEVHHTASQALDVMNDYVRDSLFFAQTLSPRYDRTDLARICTQAIDIMKERANAHGVALKCEAASHHFRADGVLIHRMISNLLANAIDASAKDKVVTVSTQVDPDGTVRISVADEGAGIPAANLSKIFEPYFTTKRFNYEARGFGLGLTIVQKVVQLHKGTIAVASEVGKGTIITVEIPPIPVSVEGESVSIVTQLSYLPGNLPAIRGLPPTPDPA